MEYIICNISAWDFWRTPPALRDVEIPLEIALCDQTDGLGLDWPRAIPRQNARQLDLIIRERLLTDLKGVAPPVHMMLPEGIRYSSELITAHRIPKDLPREWVVDIGSNIGVLSPAFLLANSPCHADPIALALGMCEACGIYATSPQNSRIQYAFDTLRHCGELKANGALNPSSKIYEYYDSDGQRASFLDEDGEALPWSACVPVGGTRRTFGNGRPSQPWINSPRSPTSSKARRFPALSGGRCSWPWTDPHRHWRQESRCFSRLACAWAVRDGRNPDLTSTFLLT